MATPTYDLLDSVTLASSAASVTFSSIDQSYGDLVLVMDLSATIGAYAKLTFNGDTSLNYSFVQMLGDGSTTSSNAANATDIYSGVAGASDRGISVNQIMDYSATDKHKTVLTRLNRATTFVAARANRWANTSAITSMNIAAHSGDWAAGSTFYLYGIAKAL